MTKFNLAHAARDWGWVLAIALALFAVASIYLKAPKAVGIPLPGDTKVTTIARAPGPDFPVLEFCNDPTTKVVGNSLTQGIQQVPDARWTYKYTLTRGNESVEWKTTSNTDPDQQNLSADHYILNPNGIQQGPMPSVVVVANGTPTVTQGLPQVEITKAAADCIWKKGGVPKQ